MDHVIHVLPLTEYTLGLQVSKLELEKCGESGRLSVLYDPAPFFEWILFVRVIPAAGGDWQESEQSVQMAIGFSGGSVSIVAAAQRSGSTCFQTVMSFKSTSETMLYSMSMWLDHITRPQELVFAAGTMLGSAFVWRANTSGALAESNFGKPLLSLQGHQGAILRQERLQK